MSYRNVKWEREYKHKVNRGDLEFYRVETEYVQYRPPGKERLWDRECLKLNTAIRAVWMLYRRGKWDLLESIMLPRWKYEAQFLRYDDKYITTDHGLLRTEQQTEHFADSIKGVRVAASLLIEDYRMIYSERIENE